MGEFTHFNGQGEAIMVDVSEKQDTVREATASGRIRMSEECYAKVKAGGMKKGDVLGVAADRRHHGNQEDLRADSAVPYPESQ